MRSLIHTNVNVVNFDRADRINVAGMTLHRVLLGRMRLSSRAMFPSLRHQPCQRSKHGASSPAAAILAAVGIAFGCPWQPRLLAFAYTT